MPSPREKKTSATIFPRRSPQTEALILLFPNSRPARLEIKIEEAQKLIETKFADIEQRFKQAEADWLQTQALYRTAQENAEKTGDKVPPEFNLLWNASQWKYRNYQALLLDIRKWFEYCQKEDRHPDSFRRLGMAIRKTLQAIIDSHIRVDDYISERADLINQRIELRSQKRTAYQKLTDAESTLSQAQHKLRVAQNTLSDLERQVLITGQHKMEADAILEQTEIKLRNLKIARVKELMTVLEQILTIEEEIETVAQQASTDKWKEINAFYMVKQNRSLALQQIMNQNNINEEEALSNFYSWLWPQADSQANAVYRQVLATERKREEKKIELIKQDIRLRFQEFDRLINQLESELTQHKMGFVDATQLHDYTLGRYRPQIVMAEAGQVEADKFYQDCLVARNLSLADYLMTKQSLKETRLQFKKINRELESLLNQPARRLPHRVNWPEIPKPAPAQPATSQPTVDDFAGQFKGMRIGQELAHALSKIPYP